VENLPQERPQPNSASSGSDGMSRRFRRGCLTILKALSAVSPVLLWAPLGVLLVAVGLGLLHHAVASRPVEAAFRFDSPPLPRLSLPAEPAVSTMRVAVAPTFAPGVLFGAYRNLADRLAVELHREVEVCYPETYASLNALWRGDAVDLAFVGLGGYWAAPEEMDVLAAPVRKGRAEYDAVVLVPSGSSARTLLDLRGKEFLFTDPDSYTGHTYVSQRLEESVGKAELFFRSVQWAGSHDRAFQAVARSSVDGAAVSGAVYGMLASRGPALAARVRVLECSAPLPSPPVVVRKSLADELRRRLLGILVGLSGSTEGREILTALGVERFAPSSATAYRQPLPPRGALGE